MATTATNDAQLVRWQAEQPAAAVQPSRRTRVLAELLLGALRLAALLLAALHVPLSVARALGRCAWPGPRALDLSDSDSDSDWRRLRAGAPPALALGSPSPLIAVFFPNLHFRFSVFGHWIALAHTRPLAMLSSIRGAQCPNNPPHPPFDHLPCGHLPFGYHYQIYHRSPLQPPSPITHSLPHLIPHQ